MNATEKAHELCEHGYSVDSDFKIGGIANWRWLDAYGHVVAIANTNNKAINTAHKHLKKVLSFDIAPNSQPESPVVEASEAEGFMRPCEREYIAKLEADLASAKEIIVQAGAMVEKKSRSLLIAFEGNVELRKENEALQAENVRIIGLVMNAISDIENDSPTFALSILDKIVKTASTEAPNAVQAVTLRQPFPKYQIGQTISVCHNYGDGAYAYKPAKVVEIKQEDGANHYRVHYLNALLEGTEFWEEYQLAQSWAERA